jgi:FkbM family methyltransferase
VEELVTVDCGFWTFKAQAGSGRARHGKYYESAKVKFFEQNIKPGDTFVDVGACEGFFTLMGMQFTGRDGHVVAFEPSLDNVALLEDNIRMNSHFFGLDDRIQVVRSAASNYNSLQPLYIGAGPGMHSLASGLRNRSPFEPELVPTVRLDDFQFLRPPDGMKIDVEGHELEVLLGMRNMILDLRYIAVDVHPSLGVNVHDVERSLVAAGFDIVPNDGHNEVHGVRRES